MSCINRKNVNTPASFPGYKSLSYNNMPKGKSGEGGYNQINRKNSFTPDPFPGYKCLSAKKGVVSAKPTSGMVNPGGRIGSDSKGYKSGSIGQGPHHIGSGKKTQRGHKGK